MKSFFKKFLKPLELIDEISENILCQTLVNPLIFVYLQYNYLMRINGYEESKS